ncbi:MAG: flagellar basal body-associated FliL family protein [Planctomycetales bacterium]|nr:flagellar basal body-associated FliL family protein [Planctomycetales bacterium]
MNLAASRNRAGLCAWQPVCLVLAILLCEGCFNAEALIESRRAFAIRARLEEVDLGKFVITLPQPADTVEAAEIYFHVFGQVANRDVHKVEELLISLGPELRHRLLLATRQLTVEDIQDPPLTALRTRIAEVVNETLPDEPLQSVGFYQFRYSNL